MREPIEPRAGGSAKEAEFRLRMGCYEQVLDRINAMKAKEKDLGGLDALARLADWLMDRIDACGLTYTRRRVQ